MKEVLDQISICILKITQLLAPFIPNGAERVYSIFGLDNSYLSFDKFNDIIEKKTIMISKPEPIFMRIDG
jgi:methionyl-tRNA synthetase